LASHQLVADGRVPTIFVNAGTVYSSGIAATLLALLGVDHKEFSGEDGEPIDAVWTDARALR
jgi:hypothetical protein